MRRGHYDLGLHFGNLYRGIGGRGLVSGRCIHEHEPGEDGYRSAALRAYQ